MAAAASRPPPRRRSVLRRAGRLALLLLLGLVGLMAAAFGALQTGAGKNWLATTLSEAASAASGFQIRIAGIDGTVPSDMRVALVEIADSQGVWLRIEQAALRWQPAALLGGRLEVARLAAGRVAVARAPVTPPAPPEPAPEPGPLAIELPSLPLPVSLADLEIAALDFGAPLAGEAVGAAAFGSARLGGAPGEAEIALDLVRLDGKAGRVTLRLAQAQPSGALTLEAEVSEPAGGLVAGLLGRPDLPGIDLRLAGSGPVDGWTGRLAASAGAASVGLDLDLAIGERVDLALRGTVDPGDLAGPTVAEILTAPASLDAALAWRPGAELDIDHAALAAPGLSATLAGTLDEEAGRVDALATLAVDDPELVARLADAVSAGPVGAGPARLHARATGNLDAPALAVELQAEAPAAPGIAAGRLDAGAEVTPAAGGRRFDIALRVMPRDLAIEDAAAASLLGPAPRISLDATYDRTTGRLDIARMAVAGAALEATGDGLVAADGRDIDVKLALRLDDLAPLGALAGQEMSGGLNAEMRVSGDAVAPRLDVDLKAGGDGLNFAEPLLRAAIGAAPQLAAGVTITAEGVDIADARLDARALSARASGRAGDDLDLDVEATAPDLAALSTALGVDLAGGLRATAEIAGPAAAPRLDGRLSGSGVAVAGRDLGDPSATVRLGDLAAPRGNLHLAVAPAGRALTVDTGFALAADGGVALDGIVIEGAGDTRLAGDLAVTAGGGLDGALEGQIADLAAWQELAGTPLGGAIGLRLAAESGAGGQHLSLAANGRAIAAAGAATLQQMSLEVAVADALAAPVLEARLDAAGVAAGAVSFDRLSATGQGALDDLGWTVSAEGADDASPRLAANGRLALAAGGGTVTVAALDAALPPVAGRLNRPATIVWEGESLRLDDLDAALGDGRLQASLDYAPGEIALEASLADLPLGPIVGLAAGVEIAGRLSGTASLSGDPAAPEGRARLTLADLRQAGVDPAEAMALSGTAEATLAAGRADLVASLAGASGIGLEARLSAPTGGDGPLDGSISGGIDLALVPRVVDLRGDALSGRLDVDLALAGRLEAPRIDGRAVISDAAYESAEAGTVLRDIAAELVGDSGRVRLVRLSAGDGNGGTLSGSGVLEIDPAAGFPVTADIALDAFTALRRPDAAVQASGELEIARNAEGGSVTGMVRVESAELRIPDQLAGEVVVLDVTEINAPPGRARVERAPSPPGNPLDLDVAVRVPRHAFLRGRGLDSEWQGRLRVGGTTAAPDIVGSLSVVRGTLDLFGHNFRFDTGEVTFVGGGAIDPQLNFVARSEVEALTVEANVSGTASAPSIRLSSDPPLPEDEVLARVLFGSSAGSLTPIQAVQLAQSAAALSGRGGSASMLDRLRQGFGLDTLGIESGETVSGSSLAVGKYITDDVFLKMNQGVTPESRRVGVEVRVLPRVTVESDIGAESQGQVGVNWKYDY